MEKPIIDYAGPLNRKWSIRVAEVAIGSEIRRGAVMAGDWSVTTDDGSISVELPEGFNGEIEADPGSDGRARSDLALVNVTGGTRSEHMLRGRAGEGGHTFRLRTSDGTIRLTR